ncbi:MAG: hypothetical protein HY201_02305 [Nitrospirae bacterium]|nr:hypothetical protein [Candidatus Troglogloeales bacterium]MBI3598276.1 hypothetical protein [Candidatus Troglogloeales bacterium]
MVRKHFCLTVVICLIISLTIPHAAFAFDDRSSSDAGDIQFILKPTYKVGEKIAFKIRNTGKVPYSYNQKYPACDFSYFDGSGREFVIPPATHCDMVVTVEIKPGETKNLFEWDQSECVQDDFGCSKSVPLPEGTYTIEGSFVSDAEGDLSTESSATIKIVK